MPTPAASQTDICNMALGRIGQGAITAIDDGSHAANLCQTAFPILLRGILADHDWNFARARQALAQDVAAPVSGFAYSYTLPPDCVRVWRLNGSDKLSWKVEKGKLLTDESTASIEFTQYIDDPVQWGGKFTEAFYVRLGSHLAGPLSGSEQKNQALLNEHVKLLFEAKAIDGQEQSNDVTVVTDLTTDVRYG